jgi:hypothetical protein
MVPAYKQSDDMICYRVDERDCITFVSPGWLRFTDENASQLTEAAVIGQPLWRYIAGDDCRQIYRNLFLQIRQHGDTASFPFRCDSPTLRRFMEMKIRPLPRGHLQFEVQRVKDDPQPYCPLIDPKTNRSEQWVTICAWCKQVKLPSGEWIDLVESARALGLFANDDVPNITHGMCLVCSEVFAAEILRLKRVERS